MSIKQRWHGKARSNAFRVKDEDAFLEWASRYKLHVSEGICNEQFYYTIWPEYDLEYGMEWPFMPHEDDEDIPNWDFVTELSKHLADGAVAVLITCGGDGLLYLTGEAIAVNGKGEKIQIALRDIYEKAEQLGSEVTDAETEWNMCL